MNNTATNKTNQTETLDKRMESGLRQDEEIGIQETTIKNDTTRTQSNLENRPKTVVSKN